MSRFHIGDHGEALGIYGLLTKVDEIGLQEAVNN